MDGRMTKEELLRFINQLFLETFHAHNKIICYVALYNKLIDNNEIGSTYPAYFNITIDAVANDFLIRLAKLTDNRHGAYGTLYKLLNLIEANTQLFNEEYRNELVLQVASDRQELNGIKTISSIKSWRDILRQ